MANVTVRSLAHQEITINKFNGGQLKRMHILLSGNGAVYWAPKISLVGLIPSFKMLMGLFLMQFSPCLFALFPSFYLCNWLLHVSQLLICAETWTNNMTELLVEERNCYLTFIYLELQIYLLCYKNQNTGQYERIISKLNHSCLLLRVLWLFHVFEGYFVYFVVMSGILRLCVPRMRCNHRCVMTTIFTWFIYFHLSSTVGNSPRSYVIVI